MLTEIIVCALASAGIVLVIWALTAALLLPARAECLLLAARGDADDLEQRVRCYRFLCESGLLHARLIVVDCGLSPAGRVLATRLCTMEGDVRLCTQDALLEQWKMEAEP